MKKTLKEKIDFYNWTLIHIICFMSGLVSKKKKSNIVLGLKEN